MIRWIFTLLLLTFSVQLHAQTPSNYGFEDGNYAGWTVSNGSTALRTSWSDSGNGVQVTTGVQNYCPGGGKCWTITPYGSYMLSIQAGGNSPQFNAAMTTLGLSASNITSIRNTIYSNGSMNPTNASSVSRTVFLQAGITYSFGWQYLSTDYVPYNDGSLITLTGGPGTPTLNGQTQNYALLGFTNPGTGNYSTNSYGATGWQVAVFTVPVDGNYMLGFSSFNLGDTALSPILFIDQLQGTTSLNGATFAPVAPNQGSSAPTAPPPPPAEPTYPTTSITTNQTIKLGQTNAITSNSIYIQNIGDNNTVNIEQFSKFNAIRGVNGSQSMLINGSNNSITINQGTATAILGNNLAEVSVTGSNNTVSLTQQYNGKYAELVMNGTGNQLTAQQKDAGGKSAFFNILGNSNVITTLQQGTGNHFLDVSAPYGGLNANITQSGAAQKLFKLIINNPGIGVTVSQTAASTADSVLMSITCTTGPCNGYSYVKN
jgi:fibronectin-binding autotransporter adhesin